uniref:Uncharacterized protein n=1 Tax=Anguilla anguilla TaxID=7936 RepID=A0A0E9VZ51_ANGAN
MFLSGQNMELCDRKKLS